MSKIETTHILKVLEIDTEKQGFIRGTPEYNKALLEGKVMKCQQMRGYSSCGACSHNPFCSLLAEFVLDSRNE